MTKQTKRRFSPEYKEQSVARLSEPGATRSSVATELGVTPTQLKTWRLELEAAGSAAATAAQKAEAAELVQLRRDTKRLTEEVEVLRKASAFLAATVAGPMAGLFPAAGSAPPSTERTSSMRPTHGKPHWRPVQAARPRAGAIPVPATQARLCRTAPTDRAVASTTRRL